MSERTCLKCGWVAFGVSRGWAENQVRQFNDFAKTEEHAKSMGYGGLSKISDYERCFRCGGNYINFREAKEGDSPPGVTISPIINEMY